MLKKTNPSKLLFAMLMMCCARWAVAPPLVFPQSESKKLNLLIISSFSKDLPAQTAFESGLNQSLNYRQGAHNVFIEFMEIPRLNEENFKDNFAAFLTKKYQGINFDVVVCWASRAIGFLERNEKLFPRAHRIFIEDMAKNTEQVKKPANKKITLVVKDDYTASLAELIRLEHPNRLYVIGTSKDRGARLRTQQFREALDKVAPEIPVEYIFDQTLEQAASVLESVKAKDAAAFYLLLFSDGQGNAITPYDAAQYLTTRSKIPIYSFWESLMGSGIVGGYLVSVEKIGFLVGKTILSLNQSEVLNTLSSMRYVYDWEALKQWSIPKHMLARDALIIHRPPDILMAYRWHIIATLAVILGLATLSLFLNRALKLRNIAVHELAFERRNLEKTVEERTRELSQTNQELTDSEERYRSLSDAAIEGIAILERGTILEANNTLAKMFGYKTREFVGMTPMDLVIPAAREDIKHKTLSGYLEPYEIMGLKKDGTPIPVQIRARMFEYKGRLSRVAVIRDLTEQKKAEAEIKALRGILPICASCKKIKDDNGTWEHLEVYINQHSEAKLSHGLCPECAKKLYPDLAHEKK